MDIFNRLNMRGNRIENCPDLDITQKEIAFQEAEKRENIKSNEKVPVIFGKISRWFADLGSHLEDKFIHVTENEREKWDKATQVSFSQNLTTGTRVGTISIDGKEYDLYCETNTDTNTDTKNTAGSTNSNSKLFLVGAAAQTENSKTYSRDSAYIGTDGCLYSNSAKTLTVGDISQSEAVTLTGRKVLDAVEKNAAVPGTLAHQISQANGNMTGKAPLKNPALTGTPTAPTASTGTNTTQIATTAFVQNALKNKTACTISLSDVSAKINSVVPYGKTCLVCLDATVANNIATKWHTIISGLPGVKENQHYQVFIFKPNSNNIEIRDGLFTSNVFNVWLDASDAGSRIIVNAMVHIS